MLKPTKHWLIHFLWSKSEIETFFQICPKILHHYYKGFSLKLLTPGENIRPHQASKAHPDRAW